MQEEEAGGGGAGTVLCSGAKLTKAGAAFVNTEIIFAGGKWDTFRMLTHPGTAILPAALAAAEAAGASGKTFLAGVAAGYEVMERMAAEFIPTVMSRGFHAGPVFGIFGGAVAAAKIGGLNAEQVHGAIAQCVNLASGNLEGARSGGRSLREGGAVRNALLAVALGKSGIPGGETVLEGEAGFYHAYAGNNRGDLRYSFTGDNHADMAAITANLGRDWIFLETLYRIYSTAGYNIAHVDVTAALCAEHNITVRPDRAHRGRRQLAGDRVSEPALPEPRDRDPPTVGSTQYFTAYGAAARGYPLLRGGTPGPGETDPPEVLDLMHRVTLIPTVRRPLFGPRITIFTKDGRSFTREGTGREFIWDFEEEVRRIRPVAPGLAIGEAQFDRLIDTCRHLDTTESAAATLIGLTIRPGEFDFVVVGGGSAGAVIAARLSEDPACRVALIEAGERPPEVELMPVACAAMQLNPATDWMYTADPGKAGLGLNGRRVPVPRGKMLGGSSGINYMAYVRGHPGDFDAWAEGGATGWSYADVLPYFRKSEGLAPSDDISIDAPAHNSAGPLGVSVRSPVLPGAREFVEAAEAAGIPRGDYNGRDRGGAAGVVSLLQTNTRQGKRSSTYRAFLEGEAERRPNLTIITGAQATRVILEGPPGR